MFGVKSYSALLLKNPNSYCKNQLFGTRWMPSFFGQNRDVLSVLSPWFSLALASIPTFDLQSLLAIPSLTIFSNSNKFWDCLFISVHHDWFRVSWLSDHVCMFWIWHHGPFHFLVAIPGPALPQRSSRRLHFDLRKSVGTPWVSPCPATTVLLYLEIYSSPGGGGDDPYPDIYIYIPLDL